MTIATRQKILRSMFDAAMLAQTLGGRIERSRTAAIARNESICMVIRPVAESVDSTGDVAQRDFVVEFIVITRGDVPDELADAAICEVHDLLCADPSFGGLAAQLFEQSSNWDFADADQTACELTVRYRVRYFTPENSLSSPLQ